jgi:hypothetical protein
MKVLWGRLTCLENGYESPGEVRERSAELRFPWES